MNVIQIATIATIVISIILAYLAGLSIGKFLNTKCMSCMAMSNWANLETFVISVSACAIAAERCHRDGNDKPMDKFMEILALLSMHKISVAEAHCMLSDFEKKAKGQRR